MPYRMFQSGQYDADVIELMSKIFDEVCTELGLANRENRLRDLIAYEIMYCVNKGHRDLDLIRSCARSALRMPEIKT